MVGRRRPDLLRADHSQARQASADAPAGVADRLHRAIELERAPLAADHFRSGLCRVHGGVSGAQPEGVGHRLMATQINRIPPPSVPLVDVRTGIINEYWWDFLSNLAGGQPLKNFANDAAAAAG